MYPGSATGFGRAVCSGKSLFGCVSSVGFPANDFSWLDLEAVGDYVSGDQISGGLLGLDAFQKSHLRD
jgi:hypothetical protein